MDIKESMKLIEEMARFNLGPEYDRILADGEERKARWNDDLVARLRWEDPSRRGILSRLKRIFSANAEKRARAQLRNKEYAKAMEQTAYALQQMMREDSRLDEEANENELYRQFRYQQAEKERGKMTREERLACALEMILDRKLVEATEALKKNIEDPSSTPEEKFIMGEVLEASGSIANAAYMFRFAVEQKTEAAGWPAQEFTESRNKVYTIEWPGFPSGKIFAKEYISDEASLTEFFNTILFRKILGSCVQMPLGFHSTNTRMLLFRAAGNRTLLDVIKENPAEASRIAAVSARMLARIHALGTKVCERGLPPVPTVERLEITDKVQDKREFFTDKMRSLLGEYCRAFPAVMQAGRIDDLAQEYAPVNDHLRSVGRDFYKDHNPRNIVVDIEGNATIIDFEAAHLMPCQIDLVSLLEFGSDYFAERRRRRIIEAYVREKEALLMQDIDRARFMQTYQYAAVQRHLELIAYRSRDYAATADDERREDNLGRLRYHLAAAEKAAERIASDGSSGSTRNIHRVIKEVVKSIKA
jgi:hypothetical protein